MSESLYRKIFGDNAYIDLLIYQRQKLRCQMRNNNE